MIGFYLHHQGSGHRVRGTLLARAVVAAGGSVTGAGTGPAPTGWPGRWTPLVADDGAAQAPGRADPSQDPTAGGVLHWAPVGDPALLTRAHQVTSWLAAERPDVVLVDVSVEVALLVRLGGVPVVVTALPGERTDRAHVMAYDLADHLLAPWPAGTHEVGWPTHWQDKTVHLGGLSRFTGRVPASPVTPVSASGARTVLALWGAGGVDVGPAELAATQEATPGWTWVHRGGGHPAAHDLWAELEAADVVVTQAGQNAVADVACAARPAVVVAQSRPHAEQEATARAVDRLGIAPGVLGWPPADRWPDLLEQAHTRGGAGWARWVGVDAATRGAELLGGYADREDVA